MTDSTAVVHPAAGQPTCESLLTDLGVADFVHVLGERFEVYAGVQAANQRAGEWIMPVNRRDVRWRNLNFVVIAGEFHIMLELAGQN